MENKNLKCYGYLLNCPDDMLGDVTKTMNDKQTTINWNNFNVGDAFYTEKDTYKCVIADHSIKRIVFVTEEEYKEASYMLKPRRENTKMKSAKAYLYDIQDELCDKIVYHWEDDERFANQREMQQYNCGVAEAMEIIRNVLDGTEFKSSLLQPMKE